MFQSIGRSYGRSLGRSVIALRLMTNKTVKTNKRCLTSYSTSGISCSKKSMA